eukprot:NODE_186_length_13589_cov_0.385545.p5 type:complete len:343 gc:universal NODE_186_length_13589_cov_0.385545:5206-6234(+)
MIAIVFAHSFYCTIQDPLTSPASKIMKYQLSPSHEIHHGQYQLKIEDQKIQVYHNDCLWLFQCMGGRLIGNIQIDENDNGLSFVDKSFLSDKLKVSQHKLSIRQIGLICHANPPYFLEWMCSNRIHSIDGKYSDWNIEYKKFSMHQNPYEEYNFKWTTNEFDLTLDVNNLETKLNDLKIVENRIILMHESQFRKLTCHIGSFDKDSFFSSSTRVIPINLYLFGRWRRRTMNIALDKFGNSISLQSDDKRKSLYAFIGAQFDEKGMASNVVYIVTKKNEYYKISIQHWEHYGFKVDGWIVSGNALHENHQNDKLGLKQLKSIKSSTTFNTIEEWIAYFNKVFQ